MTATLSETRLKPAGAIRGFFRLAQRWALSRAEKKALLGISDRSVDRWQSNPGAAEPTRDQLERISYVLGIYSTLHGILGESTLADEWVRRSNTDFGGGRPLDRMLAGNVGDLLEVRRYVDAWRTGW